MSDPEVESTQVEAVQNATGDTGVAFAAPIDRQLDLAGLKALAHPLRVEIFDTLSTYGCFTASGLAERLGESSGATSYHLRQLEKHGLVRELSGKGTSRERWWERTPGAVNIGSEDAIATPAGRSAATTIFRQLRVHEDRLLTEFVERSHHILPDEWLDGAAVATMNTRLTASQMRDFVAEVMALTEKYVTPYKNQNVPGSRPVHVVFQTFPVVDGEVAEAEPEKPAKRKKS